MDLFAPNGNPTLMPGQRLLKIKGSDAAEKYPFPRDCEAVLFDEDEPYFYIKKTDTNGGVIIARYKYEEDPIPHFDPKKYVTVDDFKSFKEEILNGFNSLQQTLSGAANANANADSSNSGYNKSGKQFNKSNNGGSQSSGNVQ